jgi:hypothetical protein
MTTPTQTESPQRLPPWLWSCPLIASLAGEPGGLFTLPDHAGKTAKRGR